MYNHSEESKIKCGGATCGLYCYACSAYIATHEEPVRLDALVKKFNRPKEDFMCNGCGSDKISFYCTTCEMKKCASEKGYSYCSECDEMPCDKVKAFQTSGPPHRLDVIESLNIMKQEGLEKWEDKQKETYSCQSCGTINCAYDLKCRKCGADPGNTYVNKYKAVISSHLNPQDKK